MRHCSGYKDEENKSSSYSQEAYNLVEGLAEVMPDPGHECLTRDGQDLNISPKMSECASYSVLECDTELYMLMIL